MAAMGLNKFVDPAVLAQAAKSKTSLGWMYLAGVVGGFSASGFTSAAWSTLGTTSVGIGTRLGLTIIAGATVPVAGTAIPSGPMQDAFAGGQLLGVIIYAGVSAATYLRDMVSPYPRPSGTINPVGRFDEWWQNGPARFGW